MEKISVVREKEMKIKVLKQTDNELKLEIEGEGHSLLNLLQKALLEDDNIAMAGYDVPHPLFDRGILYVQTKDKQNPADVVKEAVKKVQALNKDFDKSFNKASKAYKEQ
jgi:DNA-directed RNA polymerase subunit L